MLKDKPPITTSGFTKGLYTKGNILINEPGHSPDCMDIKWNFDESIQKRLGSTTRNVLSVGSTVATGWTQNASGTLSTGLLSWYKLDEPSGSRRDEYSSNDLTQVNSPTDESGRWLQAVKLVAANSQYLYNASQVFTGSGNNISISTWFYLNSTSNTEIPIVTKCGVDSFTKVLLHCDGTDLSTTFTDSSPVDSKTVTAQSGAKITTTSPVFGTGCGVFNGTTDYLTIPDSDDFDFGADSFTFDFRVKFNSVAQSHGFIARYDDGSHYFSFDWRNTNYLYFRFNNGSGLQSMNWAWTPSTATWYHVALVRNGNTFSVYIDGAKIGSDQTNSISIPPMSGLLRIGRDGYDNATYLNGWLDEVRISKGIARWTANFTAPTAAYVVNYYEYYLYVNSDNYITWRVSSSGTVADGSVQATSMGTVNTSTWYHVVAWHTTGDHIGVSANLSVDTAPYISNIGKSAVVPFMIGAASNNTVFMNGRIDETGFWTKPLVTNEIADLYGGGTGNSYNRGKSGYTWGLYDFGATNLRWLVVAAGTGVYASSNMGLTFVVATTTRTQNYQSFERSKNVLIATSDSYDLPLYWAGSVGTYMQILAPGSAPAVKFSKNYQGYLILLNQSTNKRRFAYEFDSLQLTSAWPNYFDLPSSADDEITDSFTVNRIYYVSTRYRIFKLSPVGGNPDWSYTIVKEWGYVPHTVKIVFMQDREWAIGMDWNRRIRAFDGYNEIFISNNIEADNNICDFAMSKISFSGSGLAISNAVFDPIEQEYRLNVAIGEDSQNTTHSIVLNARSLALYPYQNQFYQAMCVAESNNRQYLLASDRDGYVHLLNDGYTDSGTVINEHYESPYIYNKVPGMVSKGGKLDLFFKPTATGTVYYQDKVDFAKNYGPSRKEITVSNDGTVSHVYKSVDLPTTHNIFQYKLMSSSNTAEPWVLTHSDLYQQAMGIGKGN